MRKQINKNSNWGKYQTYTLSTLKPTGKIEKGKVKEHERKWGHKNNFKNYKNKLKRGKEKRGIIE